MGQELIVGGTETLIPPLPNRGGSGWLSPEWNGWAGAMH